MRWFWLGVLALFGLGGGLLIARGSGEDRPEITGAAPHADPERARPGEARGRADTPVQADPAIQGATEQAPVEGTMAGTADAQRENGEPPQSDGSPMSATEAENEESIGTPEPAAVDEVPDAGAGAPAAQPEHVSPEQKEPEKPAEKTPSEGGPETGLSGTVPASTPPASETPGGDVPPAPEPALSPALPEKADAPTEEVPTRTDGTTPEETAAPGSPKPESPAPKVPAPGEPAPQLPAPGESSAELPAAPAAPDPVTCAPDAAEPGAPTEGSAAPAAKRVAGVEVREDGTAMVEGRFAVKGKGTEEAPYELPWELLVDIRQSYDPRAGKSVLPAWTKFFDGKVVKITGYLLLPLAGEEVDELLVMRNQWDGCCIGVPPTAYDAVEVKLSGVVRVSRFNVNFGSIVGYFKVDPYLSGKWLIGLYVMEDCLLHDAAGKNLIGT
ncbi:MAG: hypothetical protein IT439_09975 [Phycisphaerales bacterium]|nr:hypothetical protein [Phycisphaerales bacterium]